MSKQAKVALAVLILILTLAIAAAATSKPQKITNEYFIINPIDNGVYHHKVATELLQAKKGDRIVIHIDSPGGNAEMGYLISDAILKTEAEVTCKVRKLAASAAAVILASCHKVVVPDDAHILFHAPYIPDIFNTKIFEDSEELNENEKSAFRNLLIRLKLLMAPVLTEWQIRAVVFNKLDIWMSGAQYKEQICKFKNMCERNRRILSE